MSLLAVHISDGLLWWPWWVGGYVCAIILGWLGSRRLGDEEIPRIAVMSSVFFVASLIPIPVGMSVHLLLNGLVGIVLGPRAVLAIPMGLFLQAVLFSHGGFSTLGVNSCVMVLPALGVWLLFAAVRRWPWLHSPRRLGVVGFLFGVLAVLASATLNFIVLGFGGEAEWPRLAQAAFILHLPVMAVEGFIMAATVSFLAKVKPEMLGLRMPVRHKPENKPLEEVGHKAG